jgi:hypothetical protein
MTKLKNRDMERARASPSPRTMSLMSRPTVPAPDNSKIARLPTEDLGNFFPDGGKARHARANLPRKQASQDHWTRQPDISGKLG